MSQDNSHPYSHLTPERVVDAVESTGLLSDARILALNSYENRVYQVGIEALADSRLNLLEVAPVIAKFYRPQRWTNEQIIEEHEFTHYLYERDIPVVPPLRDAKGESLFTFDGFRFALYPRQGGRPVELDNLDQLFQMGRCLGRIHAAGAGYSFKHRQSLSLQSMMVDSVEFLLSHDFIPSDLIEAYQSLVDDVIQLCRQQLDTYGELPYISLHGDCHAGNVLWRDGGPHFVDFDDAISGPAMQDIWMLLSGDRAQRVAQLMEIVEGYNEFYHFDAKQLRLIEVLRAMRMLHYSAWLARRWEDPAFPASFTWFNTARYWSDQILALREQYAALQEEPLTLPY